MENFIETFYLSPINLVLILTSMQNIYLKVITTLNEWQYDQFVASPW